VTDPAEGDILVASRNPEWQPEAPRWSRVLEVKDGSFETVLAMVERAAKARNASLPAGALPVVVVGAERARKIFIGAGSREDLEAVAEVGAEHDRKDPARPRYYTYLGRYRSAAELQDLVVEELEEGELNRLRIVVATRGNRLLLRAPPELWEKVERLLRKLDVKAPPR
jgi:hypothetical protein